VPTNHSRRRAPAILCFDLGGTKLRGALVSPQGRVLKSATQLVDQKGGFPILLDLFVELASSLGPKSAYSRVSIASAGPLHSGRGVLLDPTNFFTDQKSWGVLPLVAELKKRFRKPVLLENDAAAAALGEAWKGGHGASTSRNLVMLTLGTGLGVGVIVNGQLLRAGRGLHPEAGHLPLNIEASDHPCGCGSVGCMEVYLAGSHFVRRAQARFKGPVLNGADLVALAQGGDPLVSAAHREWLRAEFTAYGRRLAHAIRGMCLLFAPEVVVLAGGFSHASSLYLPEAQRLLPELMRRYRVGVDLVPKVEVSRLGDDAGVIGAARTALLASE